MLKQAQTRTRIAALSLLLTSCASLDDETSDVDGRKQEIIGGVAANGAGLDSVAVLAFEFENQYIEPFRTAARIGSRTFVTAKHCVDRLYWGYGGRPILGIGPDGMHPAQTLSVVEAERAPGNEGGVLGGSPDVAVVHTDVTVAGLDPLSPAQLGDDDIGQNFAAVGYGTRDNLGRSGVRRAGTLTLRALKGKFFELVFGSFEKFKEWFETGGYAGVLTARSVLLPPAGANVSWDELGILIPGAVVGASKELVQPEQDDAWLRQIYDNTLLAAGSEAWLGHAPGNAQPCFGDSGSPLIRRGAAGLRVYGVTSGGLSSRDLVCDFGAVYGIFSDATLAFLHGVTEWQDPCEGLPAEGLCEADVARRCTAPFSEGRRRVVETDCALLGQICGRDATGELGCVDANDP